MTKRIRSTRSETTSPNGARAASYIDRAAFQESVSAHLEELLAAAQRELRYRVDAGDLSIHDLTPAELVDEAVLRAWRNRHSKFSLISVRAWFLAMLFRTAEDIARNEAKIDSVSSSSLREPGPVGLVYDDDEAFWEWYQPEEVTRQRGGARGRSALSSRMTTAMIAEMPRALGPDAYQVFLLHEIHRLPLRAVTMALGIPTAEASRLLTEARHYVQAVTKKGVS